MWGVTTDRETVVMMVRENANRGDTFSFVLQVPTNPHWKKYTWFGKQPKLVQAAVQLAREPEITDEESGPTFMGLPDHHARNFDAGGYIILPPRPSDLEAQRRAFRASGA